MVYPYHGVLFTIDRNKALTRQTYRDRKKISGCQGLGVGGRVKGNAECLGAGTGFPSGVMECSEVNSDDGLTTRRLY